MKRRATSFAALAAVAAAVAVSCFDRGSVAALAAAKAGLDAALLSRTALALVRAAAACCLAAAGAMLLAPRLRRPAAAFAVVAVLVGPLYAAVVTPFSVPDETFHYRQVLSRAAPLAGAAELGAEFALGDLGRFLHRNRPEGYVFLGGGSAGADGGKGTVRPGEWGRKGNFLMYLPQTAGVAAALRAGAGPRGAFYAGRAAALAFYAVCVFFAIRLAPALRRTLAAVALCPIALQQASSFSYDCAALSAGFLCFAFFLRLAARDCGAGGPAPRALLAAAAAAAAAGMAVKGSAAAFLPLLAAVPAAGFRRGAAGKAAFLVFVAATSAAALAAAFSAVPGIVRDLPPGTLPGGGRTHSAAALLLDPAGTARMLLRTFDFDAVQLFFDAFGSRMSGLTRKRPAHVTLAFAAAVLASVRGDRRLPRSAAVRYAAAAGTALLTVYLCAVMLVADTPEWAGNVWNLQGRYWTPVLPLAACALFAREGRPEQEARPAGLVFPAIALLHLDAAVFVVKTTLAA